MRINDFHKILELIKQDVLYNEAEYLKLLSIPACFIPSFRREDTANPVDKIPQFREWSTIIPELDTADFLNLYTVFMRLTA